jgi:hypothetical protein
MAKSPRKAEPAIPVSDELIPIAMKASPDAGGEVVQPAAAEAPFNALREMQGKPGAELQAVYLRLAETLPFLNAAVAQAEGELQQFLADLLADLTRGAGNGDR